MKKRIALFTVLAIALCAPVKAQFNESNNLFYHALRTPQSNIYNPALFPTNTSFYLALPGVDFQFGSPLPLKNIIYYDKASQHTLINLDTILHGLNGENFRMATNINLLGFGFKVNNMFFTFNTRLMNTVNFGLPVSTVNALTQGNIDETGAPIQTVDVLNGDILNATSYLETAIGAAYNFESLNLTVGARAKLLFGVINIQTDNTKVVLNTESGLDSVSARLYYEIQAATAAPYDTIHNQFTINAGDILGSANTGFAFDLGAKYDWGPFSFSASILDLSGGIHWKNNVVTFRPKNGAGSVEFDGIDISSILNHGSFNADSLTQYLQNQLSGMTPTRKDSGDYWFAIPTKINLGASYSFAKIFRAGLLFHGQLDRGLFCKSTKLSGLDVDVPNTFRWNTTLSVGANIFNWAEVIVGSSIVYDGDGMDFFNPGAGIILTPATIVQLYVMADYISSIYVVDSKGFNLKFGLNILLGKGNRTVVEAE